MSSEHYPDPVEAVGHERRDVNVRATAIFLVVLQGSMLACCVLGLIFHKAYLHWMKVSAISISPIAVYVMDAPPPRLQVDPAAEFETHHALQQEALNSYAWLDAPAGTVRLPIEEAKRQLLKRGLPARRAASPS